MTQPSPTDAEDDDLDETIPSHRDKVVSFRVPPDQYARAKKRARKQGRSLVGVLRSWFKMFANDEAPLPPELPDENERAPKRKARKKK